MEKICELPDETRKRKLAQNRLLKSKMYDTLMIYYTGIGSTCNKTEFTDDEFVKIMNEQFTYKKWKKEYDFYQHEIQLKFRDWVLPDDFIFFTLDDWIEFSGAEIF
jgi:hypothetical protein